MTALKPDTRLPYPPPYMDLATLAQHICSSTSTIENWVRQGLFPPPRKVGGKNLWRWKEVDHHLAVNPNLTASSDDEAAKIREATRAAASRSH